MGDNAGVGIPMTAKDQLLRARELGHELTVLTRHHNGSAEPVKYWLKCTCGYSSTARRTKAQVNGVMVWHLGNVIAESMAGDRVNGR